MYRPRVTTVMSSPTIDPSEFVALVEPLLERRDAAGLRDLVRARWTRDQLKAIVHGDHLDARKVACLALALVGGDCAIPCLAEQLKSPDKIVNQMAEHALWSIWLRGGAEDANRELCRGAEALNRRELNCATKHFTRAIEADPSFAEAYNQRAITHYLAERYEESIADCQAAIERMPCHFGAWAGMGHCHAHEGRMAEAIKCYERAIEINPHLDGIEEVLLELKGQRSE